MENGIWGGYAMAGLTAAYFISPKGEVIYCGNNHITKILQHPEKFGMTKDIISYIYNTYNN